VTAGAYTGTVIDWRNGAVVKLSPVAQEEVLPELARILVAGEEVLGTWKTFRDFVAFTNKRVITVNVEGVSGKRRTYTTFPFKMGMALYSVRTPSSLDISGEVELNWNFARLTLQFKGEMDMEKLSLLLARITL
jgi:hypothetical protein